MKKKDKLREYLIKMQLKNKNWQDKQKKKKIIKHNYKRNMKNCKLILKLNNKKKILKIQIKENKEKQSYKKVKIKLNKNNKKVLLLQSLNKFNKKQLIKED